MRIMQPDTAELKLPAFVQIEPVGQCNLRCPMCSIQFRKDGPPFGPPAYMRLRVFKELVDQFDNAEDLHLQGMGEPLLHPAFFEMVAYAARRGIRVTTNSNMTLFDPDRAEECVRSGLSWIRISIDGATPGTYELIRKGARFRLVLQNIALLQAAKERLGSSTPRLFFVMVAMRKNIHELNDVIRLAHRFSISEVFVQHLCHAVNEEGIPAQYQSLSEFVEGESLLGADRLLAERCFLEARGVADELNIRLRLPGLDIRDRPAGPPGRGKCGWPWDSAYVSYNGLAMPCCIAATPDRINFGSMVQDGVKQIWNSAAYQDFRSRLDSDDPPPICRSCSIYRGTF